VNVVRTTGRPELDSTDRGARQPTINPTLASRANRRILENELRSRAVSRSNPTGDFIQFIIGGCLFGAGGFLLSNQVMVHSAMGWQNRGGWLGGWQGIPFGTPGLGLLMIPLGIGVCLLFAETRKRLANLLIWASLAALLVGVLNSVRISFRPTTLWQLGVYIVMMAAGGGLMFRGLRQGDQPTARETGTTEAEALRREIEALRREIRGNDRS